MNIKNAASYHLMLGTDDKSSRQLTPEELPIPQHLPIVFLQTPKGPTSMELTTGAQRLLLYGAETYNKKGAYYNHQTLLSEKIGAKGNILATKRIVMPDAGVESNVALYIDVALADLPNYKRTSQGVIVYDESGNAEVDSETPTIEGYKIKFITEHQTEDFVMGTLTSKPGTMTNKDATSSTMYPIKEDRAMYQGAAYNNLGYTIKSLLSGDFPDSFTTDGKYLPYKVGFVERTNPKVSPTIVKSLYGEASVMAGFVKDAVHPVTEGNADVSFIMDNQWANTTDPVKPLVFPDYSKTKVYYDNLNLVLGLIMAKEKDYLSFTPQTWSDNLDANTMSWFDFTTDDNTELLEELHLINWVTGKSSKNVKYHTLEIDSSTVTLAANQKEEVLSESTPIYLRGGSDGTLTNENYEAEIVKYMQNYLDESTEVMDLAVNVDSIIYDSGFELDTKKELCNYIAVRKDTIIALTTHTASLGELNLALSEEKAMADALKARLNLTPESEYFGTGVCRGIVVGGTADLNDDSISDRVPLILQVSEFAADYFGAGTGKWKQGKAFDEGSKTIISGYKNIAPTFIPNTIKPTLWNSGLIYPQPFDRRNFHFPAMQTVYDDDTSILNSFFVIMAISHINKVADKAHKNFTGSTKLSEAQFIENVTNYCKKRLKSEVFDNMFVIVPVVTITESDALKGYSWTLTSKIYANNMKTVMTSSVEAWRMSDLNQ